MRKIRTPDWKCNRSRLKVKWRRVLLAETRRKGVRYGMVVKTNIVPVLNALKDWVDEIYVVDSQSTDGMPEEVARIAASTLDSQPSTLNPQPSTLNSQLSLPAHMSR